MNEHKKNQLAKKGKSQDLDNMLAEPRPFESESHTSCVSDEKNRIVEMELLDFNVRSHETSRGNKRSRAGPRGLTRSREVPRDLERLREETHHRHHSA